MSLMPLRGRTRQQVRVADEGRRVSEEDVDMMVDKDQVGEVRGGGFEYG